MASKRAITQLMAGNPVPFFEEVIDRLAEKSIAEIEECTAFVADHILYEADQGETPGHLAMVAHHMRHRNNIVDYPVYGWNGIDMSGIYDNEPFHKSNLKSEYDPRDEIAKADRMASDLDGLHDDEDDDDDDDTAATQEEIILERNIVNKNKKNFVVAARSKTNNRSELDMVAKLTNAKSKKDLKIDRDTLQHHKRNVVAGRILTKDAPTDAKLRRKAGLIGAERYTNALAQKLFAKYAKREKKIQKDNK